LNDNIIDTFIRNFITLPKNWKIALVESYELFQRRHHNLYPKEDKLNDSNESLLDDNIYEFDEKGEKNIYSNEKNSLNKKNEEKKKEILRFLNQVQTDNKNPEVLIIPYSSRNHWILVLIFVKQNKVLVFDSLTWDYKLREKSLNYIFLILHLMLYNDPSFENFNNFKEKLKIFCVPLSKQQDSYNCGVYLIIYLEYILKNMELVNQFTADEENYKDLIINEFILKNKRSELITNILNLIEKKLKNFNSDKSKNLNNLKKSEKEKENLKNEDPKEIKNDKNSTINDENLKNEEKILNNNDNKKNLNQENYSKNNLKNENQKEIVKEHEKNLLIENNLNNKIEEKKEISNEQLIELKNRKEKENNKPEENKNEMENNKNGEQIKEK